MTDEGEHCYKGHRFDEIEKDIGNLKTKVYKMEKLLLRMEMTQKLFIKIGWGIITLAAAQVAIQVFDHVKIG